MGGRCLMKIASIDRGIFTTVEVDVENPFITIESGTNGIAFTQSETEQLILALGKALKELTEEPKYVVVLPQKVAERFWKYYYLGDNGVIYSCDKPQEVLEEGTMTMGEIKAISKHYEPFAIPVEEFKEKHLEGEF